MFRQPRFWWGNLLVIMGFALGCLWHQSSSFQLLTSLGDAQEKAQVKQPPAKKPFVAAKQSPPNDGKLRIIAFGAHPDDCEIRAGGVAARWAAQGHHVKFVSVTNGDIGHWRMAGGPLAKRRLAEVQKAAELLGIHTHVLDIHDGELEPTLENRKKIIRQIREWKADLVFSHRPNDYHPDHRYTGVLVQDAAFMVAVPFICPDVAPLKSNPVFMFFTDRFQRPNPFRADVIVGIDNVIGKKLAALDMLESQFFEGGALGSAKLIPKDEAGKNARREQIRNNFKNRAMKTANQYRERLLAIYGKEAGAKIQFAEAFELCEYGRQPKMSELLKMFPLE